MNANDKKETTDATAAEAAIKIEEWWAVTLTGLCPVEELILARTADRGFGLLKVELARAFDGSGDWCSLSLFAEGEGIARRLDASRVDIPSSLRTHILRKAVECAAKSLAESIDEDLVSDIPAFATYVQAREVAAGAFSPGHLKELTECISAEDGVGYADESDIDNLKRLVRECKREMRSGRRAGLPAENHGRG